MGKNPQNLPLSQIITQSLFIHYVNTRAKSFTYSLTAMTSNRCYDKQFEPTAPSNWTSLKSSQLPGIWTPKNLVYAGLAPRYVANVNGLNVAVWPIYRTPLSLSTNAKAITTKHHIAVLE